MSAAGERKVATHSFACAPSQRLKHQDGTVQNKSGVLHWLKLSKYEFRYIDCIFFLATNKDLINFRISYLAEETATIIFYKFRKGKR